MLLRRATRALRDGDGGLDSLATRARDEDGCATGSEGSVVAAVGGLAWLLWAWGVLLSLVEGGARVDTGPLSFGTVALVERSSVVVGGLVPVASHDVVDVWAPLLLVRSVGVAGSDTELAGRDEVLPLLDSLELASVGASVDELTDWVAVASGSVGVELTTLVTSTNADLGEVTDTGDLDVRGSLEEVSSLDGTVGDQTGTVSRLETVGDDLGLLVTNGLVRARGAVHTEIFNGINVQVLALGLLAAGTVSLSAVVVAVLTSSRVGLGWEVVGGLVGGLGEGGEGEEGEESELVEHCWQKRVCV